MATAAIIGLSAGKRLLNSSSASSHYSDITERLVFVTDYGFSHCQYSCWTKNMVVAKKSSKYSKENTQSIKAVKDHVVTISSSASSEEKTGYQSSDELEEGELDREYSVEALLLLQKAMLEKQWNLSFEKTAVTDLPRVKKKRAVTCSGSSARQRRIDSRVKVFNRKELDSVISSELFRSRSWGYVKGAVSDQLLPHAEVVQLSKIIRTGLSLEEKKSRLKERLGADPTDEQLATSLRISLSNLRVKIIECSLAREKLAMSNVRLVLSIAQRYEHMGAEMGDLVQGGLIGLLRGIEKFDSSKGFKISTYVYWWIRQGVSRALVDNSRTLRLPTYLHERLGLIRNAKIKLEEQGITPTIDKIAETLKMSKKKVRNATEANNKVFSLDRDVFPSLNGLPGETHHSYIADNCEDNIPWHGVHESSLKNEVNKLINLTLGDRERDIIRLYYGIDNECLTWEDISKRIGLSRERVRQVGLVALEKLKNGARKKNMEAMLFQQH